MSDFYNDRMEFFRETGAKQAPSAGEGDAGNGGNEEIFDRGLLQDNSAADTAETFSGEGVYAADDDIWNTEIPREPANRLSQEEFLEETPVLQSAGGFSGNFASVPETAELEPGIEKNGWFDEDTGGQWREETASENTRSGSVSEGEAIWSPADPAASAPSAETADSGQPPETADALDSDETSESEELSVPAEHRDLPPDFALIPPAAQAPSKLISADEDLKSSRLKITGVYHLQLPVITIEEDVLVPDVEPDLEQILNIEARPEISSHETIPASDGKDTYKISGSISVNTLYLPVSNNGELISMNSRIDFRRECAPLEAEDERSMTESGRSSDASEVMSAELLSVKARVINERKIRISAELRCTIRKYCDEETEFLEGVRDGELNLRKETIRFTDIAQRRRDTMDISGEVVFKENMPEPGQILNYDVNIVESRRQIGRGKAVIDAGAYYSILYMPKTGGASSKDPEESGEDDERIPVFCRGKIDFTQFVKFPDSVSSGDPDSRVTFEVISSQLDFEVPEEGGPRKLMLRATVAASVDVFRRMEREIVTDMYHRTKNVDFSTTARQVAELCGSGAAEISVREIITLPETKTGFRRIPYISAAVENLQIAVENGRCRVEGLVDTNSVYEEEEGGAGFSSFAQKLPFRTQIDIPGISEGMTAEYSCGLKDIWFDRMNALQVEFNCTIYVSVYVWNVEARNFIDRVCYIEDDAIVEDAAGMVIYITRPGDTQWSIAKEFRTTMQQLRLINNLEESDYIEEGRKLLIL